MKDKLTDKIIIHNYTDLSDYDVLLYINVVINQGKISNTSQGEQYSFVTIFKNGITVCSGRKNNTYTFIIERRDIDAKSGREDSDI
jgi:hypothetical protein